MAPTDLPTEDLLIQLAEECGELIQAATKLIRYGRSDSYVSPSIVLERNLVEEMADVQVVIEALLSKQEYLRARVDDVRMAKTDRWNKRLNRRNDER